MAVKPLTLILEWDGVASALVPGQAPPAYTYPAPWWSLSTGPLSSYSLCPLHSLDERCQAPRALSLAFLIGGGRSGRMEVIPEAGIATQACNPGSQEVEAGRSRNPRSSLTKE